MIRCAVIGFGFLGKNLLKALEERLMEGLKVVAVANSRGYVYSSEGIKYSELPKNLDDARGFKQEDPLSVVDKRSIDLVVELTPTNITTGRPGIDYIREALDEGIDVVTANKGPLVVAFRELHERALSSGALLRYEATVGGGIPIFSLVKNSLRGDVVLSIRGILNGTTNYVLTRMHFEGMSMDLALSEAQMLGIAERDPSLDVDGIDTACKVVILANSLMGMNKKLSDVKVVGIRKVTNEAIQAAKELGMTIKLIGSVSGGKLSVEPMLLRLNHPFCVHGTLNAINLKTKVLGDLTLIGHGAGESTVASLLNDIADVLQTRIHGNARGKPENLK